MNIQSTRLAPQAQGKTVQKGEKVASQQESKCEEKPGFFSKAVDSITLGAKNTLQEGVLAAKNDPALAMRVAATTLSDTLLKKVDAPVKAGFEKTIVPVMRFALLGGNVLRAYNTFNNPVSSRLERTLDAGVVASDLVGALGGIGMLIGGRFAGIGETMMGFSYAVDAVSHAYRGLDHAGKRIAVWTAEAQQPIQPQPSANPK